MERSPPSSPTKPRGRPREFDRDAAVEAAMMVFWERGFEGASMNELLAAMNIRSPSLYAAFGSKAALFIDAVTHYQSGPGRYAAEALALAPTRIAVAELLSRAVAHFTTPGRPTGCLVVLSGLSCDPVGSPDVAEALAQQRRTFEHAVRLRIARGRQAGDVPAGADAAALARYVVMIFQGLAVAARQGATRSHLMEDARRAMAGWPDAAREPDRQPRR